VKKKGIKLAIIIHKTKLKTYFRQRFRSHLQDKIAAGDILQQPPGLLFKQFTAEQES
jgi:hypothetical protein